MEYRKEYKKVQATIEECEKQLAVCESLSTSCEQSGDYAVRQIEDYFAVCMNALARRKQTLVEEVKQKVEQNKQRIQETRVKLETSIEACKQTLKASALIHEVNSTKAEEILNVMLSPLFIPSLFSPFFSFPLYPFPFSLFITFPTFYY
jgi:predicted ribosome quality control (RQC) complex YloA/Tae2 family protein